ncbi:MAG: XRE family transcriptional regulator [Cytophagales bacterium]
MFHQNLKYLRKTKAFTQEAMAAALGITRTLYKDYEYQNTPSLEMLTKMADYFSVSLDDLIRIDLEKRTELKIIPSPSMLPASQYLKTLVITVDQNQNEFIQYVPIKAKAGYLSGYADPGFVGQLPSFRLPYLPVGTYRAFEISGDSMPPLQTGAVVIGKYVENFNYLKNLHTYILLTLDEGVVYKRLIYKPRENKIICISDNAHYPPYSIKAEDIKEIWSYTCHIDFNGSETAQKYLLKEWVEKLDKEEFA